MRIYNEQKSTEEFNNEEFNNIVKALIALTKKLRSYCTSDEAYNSLQNNMNREGR